tara:strand:+ start:1852 stop:2463 length:612 start_codon:yes stop_codon:yes gene_type:complete
MTEKFEDQYNRLSAEYPDSLIFKVEWLEGYGDAPSRLVTIEQMRTEAIWENFLDDEFGLSKMYDVEQALINLPIGSSYEYQDPSGTIRFHKLYTMKQRYEFRRDVKKYFDSCVEDLEIPEGWECHAYYNDVCPSWEFNGWQVFIEHRHFELREYWDGLPRFNCFPEADYGDTENSETFETDSWSDMIAFVNSKKAEPKGWEQG